MILVGTIAEGVLFTNGGRSPAGVYAVEARRSSLLQRCVNTPQGERNLAKPNFGYQKRQKELEKKRKKEEKLKKRQERAATPPAEGAPPTPEPGEAA